MPTPSKGYWLDGTRIPGVTTISGFKAAPALNHWYYKQGAAGIPIDQERDRAAKVGTVTHAMVEAFCKGSTVGECLELGQKEYAEVESESWQESQTAFSGFIEWAREHPDIVVTQTEVALISKKHRFGGTLDAIATERNTLALLDWKTSGGIYGNNLVQLSAYKNLWDENFPENPITGNSYIGRFSKEFGNFTWRRFASENLVIPWRQFLRFREAYEDDKIIDRLAK